HEGPDHLRMRPALEAVRPVPALPVDERRPWLRSADAFNHAIQPGADLPDQGLVVEDKPKAERAVQPIGALLKGPAGAIRLGPGRLYRRALPTVGKGGMPLVQVPRDAVASRLSPVPQPRRPHHRAQ